MALALAPGTLLAGVAGGIVFPIFPIVGKAEHLPLALIGFILAANRAMRVVSSPFVGLLSDRIGGRRTLLAGLALQIVVMGLYLFGVARHHVGAAFLVGRLLHGPASACVFVSAQALTLHVVGSSPGGGGAAAGTVRASIVLGVPVGFVLGGILSEAVGNVVTFGVAAGAIVAALLAAWALVPDVRAPAKRAPSLREVVRSFADRRLVGIGGLNFALSFAAGGMVLTTLALLVSDRHLSVFHRSPQGTAGLLMAILSVVDAATTPLLGRLGDRRRAHARVAAASLVVVAVGILAIGFAPGVGTVAAGIALVGLGTAGLGPSVLVLMGAIVPPDRRGVGAGVLQLCGDVGGMLGPLIGTTLLAGQTALPYVLTAILVVAFVPVALWLERVVERPTA